MKLYLNLFIALLVFSSEIEQITGAPQCLIANNNDRLDCFPDPSANKADCLARGCCWALPNEPRNNFKDSGPSIPYCYYPTNYPNYMFKSLKKTNRGLEGQLEKSQSGFLPKEISLLNFQITYETNSRVRIRITDAKNKRFEVPVKLSPPDLKTPSNPNYEVIVPSNGPFSLEIKRKSDSQSLFKSFGPLLYSDQFIQISSKMSVDQIYGMGEQNRPFLHQLSNAWSRIGLWARDNPIDTYINLYGTHPFYMGMPTNGRAFGVFYLNSNAQEFVLQPSPAITFRTTGGILDIFIFTGETPETTVKQYVNLVGRPMLPSYWSLGFHLSKYGYKNIKDMSDTLQRNIRAGIPIDIQWSDIDYMDNYKDFTIDQTNYKGLDRFIKTIRQNHNTRYIAIIDPAISNQKPNTYPAYYDGLQMDIFIKDSITGNPLIGNVWPGETVFPDFTHPNITKYWSKLIKTFHDSVPVDGLWIDMNEPSSFYDGSKFGCMGNSPYDRPFFIPEIRDHSLMAKTICPSALHYNNVTHYNLHNLYGYSESVITYEVLENTISNKRPFILSRSTFSGSGKYAFHWTGDNIANWEQMRNSIRQVLNFNMFGIPMTGADICGFLDNSNEELCIRWMQLGSFYPFMRNHNTIGARDQDPASWSSYAQNIMKTTINNRYSLLPNFYTLLVKSHLIGGTVMRPLSFEFYSDKITHSIDLQFMIGSALMVMPALYQGATNVHAYFPSGVWYDFTDGHKLHSNNEGSWLNLNAPLDKINVALRGGHIVTLSDPQIKTDIRKPVKLTLYCALSENAEASGDLYWDDGESLDSYAKNKYSYIKFIIKNDELLITSSNSGYNDLPILSKVVVLGVKQKNLTRVTLNSSNKSFSFNSEKSALTVDNLSIKMGSKIQIQWK